MSISEKIVKESDMKWYAMNAFRGGALSIQTKLANLNIETFVPKYYGANRVKGNKIKYQLQAVVPSLIFIKATYSQLDEICRSMQNIHFRYTKIHGGDKNVPISVPNEDMERFIAFVDGNEEHLRYITDTNAFQLEKGEKVRIIEGPFIGKEATFVKVANETKRQIIVQVEGLLGATVICKFPSRIIEKI